MADCNECIYGNKVNWAELPPVYECLHDEFQELWLEYEYCPRYEEKPTRYEVKLSEV
jgi:hypothetical protein